MRHPRPDVPGNVCYGRADVLPKEDTLEAATRQMCSRVLATLSGARRPVAIHTSALLRAQRAAERMAFEFQVPLLVDERLAEMNFGAWEMRCWDDIARDDLDAWAQDVCGFSPPGGESAREVVLRMNAWARALRSRVSSASEVHVAIAHAGPIRLHTATALGLPTTTCLTWPLEFGHLCHLHVADDGRARLIRWNA